MDSCDSYGRSSQGGHSGQKVNLEILLTFILFE